MNSKRQRLEKLAQAIGRKFAPPTVQPVYVYRDGAIYDKHSGQLVAHSLEDLLTGAGLPQGTTIKILRGVSLDDL